MADKVTKGKYKRPPAWRMRLNILRRFNEFPDENDYYDSRWDYWEKRIRQGHTVEEKQIGQIYDEAIKQPSCDPLYDPAEFAGEDYSNTCHLTNSMYAALIVSIWSEMEHFLKDIIRTCNQALEKRKKALQKIQIFYEDTLNGKKPKPSHKVWNEILRDIQFEIPYEFNKIKDTIDKEIGDMGDRLDLCTEYPAINAIRILNNSFKHSKGYYKPENGEINEAILKKWSILDERNEIDFSKLPIKELVVACNTFCNELLRKVEAAIISKTKDMDIVSEYDVFEKVQRAFASFHRDNPALLEVNASERSISHKMAECLQREFADLNVDCEYNRKGEYPKTLENLWTEDIKPDDLVAKTVFPDIVIHKRRKQENNLLVIEIKKSNSSRSHDKDIAKLKAFTGPQYNYQIGLFLVIGVGGTERLFSDVRCFKEGEEKTENVCSIFAKLKDIGNGG